MTFLLVITVLDKRLGVAQYPNFVDHRKVDRLRNGNLLLFSSRALHEKRRNAVRRLMAHQVSGHKHSRDNSKL